MLCFIIYFLVSAQVILGQSDDDFPIINTAQGSVMGKKVNSTTGNVYYSFQGIPYAKPPLGDLRFKPPEEADLWNGTLQALEDGNVCMQPNRVPRSLLGNEDCLILNVYIPQLPDPESLLPVMVWIHGGAFLIGSGKKAQQGPDYLLEHNIIYVSINYRLGVFGFLSTEDDAAPGNNGLKDQVMALRWIQRNIAAFGGDPKKVTIFGESAGAASVQYHMLSPMSEGLFSGAIANSGAVGDGWSFALEPKENAFVLANALGFSGNSSNELVEYLRDISPQELLFKSLVTYSEDNSYRLLKAFFVPVVEPVIGGEEAFLTEDPVQLLKEGRFHKVPFLTGVNSAEGMYFITAGGILDNASRLEEIDQNFIKVFQPELMFCREEECGEHMLSQVKAEYFHLQPLSNSTIYQYIDMCTDLNFAEGVQYGIEKISPQTDTSVYLYHLVYDGGLAFKKLTTPGLNYSGVCHADDLGYLFDIGVSVAENSTDALVRSRMTTMWTNFVKTGNPTPEATDDIPAWLPYLNSEKHYLEIGAELSVKEDLNKNRMDFWRNLYQPYS